MIVAIDGPAGAGKSTVARAVAARLGFAFLDTGALYRCAVLYGLWRGLPPEEVVGDMDVRLGERILLDGEDVTSEIREPHISRLTPAAAAKPELRHALTEKQRGLLAHGDWVAEGRDIGTVVVPKAEVKVFLTASVQARAQRRASESGESVEDVRLALVERDRLDSIREHGRLHAAPEAIQIDTTDMDLTDAIDAVIGLVPDDFAQTPALFAISPEGVAPPRRRRRRSRDPAAS
jgi:CMP/dCMP kinase